MKIRYAWSPSTGNHDEITRLELESEHVPRIGEQVSIEMQLTKDEWCVKSGRVTDVNWIVHREPMVLVIIRG